METILEKYPTDKIGPERKISDSKGSRLGTENVTKERATMNNLIIWNISRAMEKNPNMNLKSGLRAAQERLERDARFGTAGMCQNPEEEHLVCALLAWQQVGRTDVDGLYQFIETKRNEELRCHKPNVLNRQNNPKIYHVQPNLSHKYCDNNSNVSRDVDSLRFGSYSKGPVVKLPVERKIVMRMSTSRPDPRRSQTDPSTSTKITAACCKDSECAKNLAAMDADTEELRTRAAQLAKREAERVELLERAEAAWGDLELGYQRRLRLAEEKEEDMTAQIAKIVQERNLHKENCTSLAQRLREIGDAAEAERVKLKAVEKTVCDRACTRLRLSEEAARGETMLAEQQCRAVQLERDLQFKEEQARRKLLTMDNETESARVLMHEAERALHAELGGLREQIGEVSTLLLEVDEMNKKIKEELEELRKEKSDIIEDLDGCKLMCDNKMQAQVDELQKKKKQLEELKEKVMECRCKLPVDVAVEVKRTASLAALCKCTSEDKFSDACSCTSLRSRLISSLLADLFSGLQSELGGVGSQMPCQMLKCLEDKHNWDRSSVIKSNLRNFFSQLLVGELDIAIATSIENYHAKWTGASCADEFVMKPSPNEDLSQGWEQRALERRAQKLAEKLAEQLFQDRAEELTERAKQIVKSGPPPCDCHKSPHKKEHAAVLQCFVKPISPFTRESDKKQSAPIPANWTQTHQDVTQLRLQIEDLKKEFIKKEDLKLMEENIAKIVKKVAVSDCDNIAMKDNQSIQSKNTTKEKRNVRNINTDEPLRSSTVNKTGTLKKKFLDVNSYSKKNSVTEKPTKQPKKYNYNQSYAVNVCMCGPQKPNKILQNAQLNDAKQSLKQKSSKGTISQVASVKQSKPIDINLPPPDSDQIISQVPIESTCGSDCKCFQKIPSNTSIDKLLETLSKWKSDLAYPREQLLNNVKSSLNSKSFIVKKSRSILKNKSKNESKEGLSTTNNNAQDNEIGIHTKVPIDLDEVGKRNPILNFTLPVSTTSEYMGAVNLDKSNEYISTCVDTVDSREITQMKENSKNISNKSTIQSINVPLNSHEEVQRSQSKDFTKVRVLNEHLYGRNKNTADLNVLTNSKSTKTVIQTEKEQSLKTNEIFNQTNLVSNELDKSQLFSNNFDYYIKFLGVTLADADSQKLAKSSVKDFHKKSKTYSPSLYKYKEPYLQNQKEDHKPETSKLFNEIKQQLKEDNGFDSPNKVEKCECNTKFEEFQRFMINIFSDQSKKKNTQQKDKALDSPSLKCTDHHIENCACCNSFNVDNSKELEVNAFYLLEDHLKQKLNEFKKCSCKSSCISPEDEEKIFSAILKRVKQVISDCANEAKSNQPGFTTDASWNRAYGLLQEYLKIKIKRVQCSTLLNENKDVMVPNILEKVCNLIETDFQRLKELCKCKKNDDALTKRAIIEHLLLPNEELPEKDTNIADNNYNTFQMVSKQNSVKPIAFIENISSQVSPNFDVTVNSFNAGTNCIVTTVSKQNSTDSIVVTQTISSQVPPALGLVTKSCNALEMENKNEQTSELKIAIFKKSQDFIYNTCDCSYNEYNPEFGILRKGSLKHKEVVSYVCTDILNNVKNTASFLKQKQSIKKHSANELGNVKSLPNIEMIESNKKCPNVSRHNINFTKACDKKPYLGCTINCTCDGHLKDCVCPKSLVQHYDDSVAFDWKQSIAKNKNRIQDIKLSYIMKAAKKNSNEIFRRISNGETTNLSKPRNCENWCETEEYDNDIVLLLSSQTIETSNQHTSTSQEFKADLKSERSNSLDWIHCPQSKSETKSSMVKFLNSQYGSEPVDESMKSCKSEFTTDSETTQVSQNCNCYKVPVCHVKMLVDDIERNIIQSKCTCDSVSKICPVHSKIFH